MNRKIFVFSVMGAMLLLCSSIFANSLDYCTDQSAGFIANHTRQAATDAADIVAYNPAGAALMQPGFYVSLSQQSLFLDYKEEFEDPSTGFKEKYKEDKPIPIYPNFYSIYNMGKQGTGNLAFSMKAGIIAGGGGLEWNGTTALAAAGSAVAEGATENGLATTLTRTDMKQEVSSQYFGFGGNVAYSLFDGKASISAGSQFIYAQKTAETTGKLYFDTPALAGFTGDPEWSMDIDSRFDFDAKGYNIILGFDVRPVEKMTFGFRYETEADLKFKYHQERDEVNASTPLAQSAADEVEDKLDVSGKKENFNLPALFACGLEYQFTPEFILAMGGDLFFLRAADMSGYEKTLQKVGYEINTGATWAVMPSMLKLHAGLTFADVGTKKSHLESEDSHTLSTMSTNNHTSKILMGGLGITYTIIPDLDVILSCSTLTTIDGKEKATTESGYKVSYYRDATLVAIGVNYKIF